MHGATMKICTLYFHVRLQKSRWFLIHTCWEEMYTASLNTNNESIEWARKLTFRADVTAWERCALQTRN